MYNKVQVDNLLTGKQNALIFRDPAQLNPLVQGFPLFGGVQYCSRYSSCSTIEFNILWE